MIIKALGALAAIVLTSSAALAQDDMVNRIKDSGTLRVCQVDYFPLNFKDPATNEWGGILVDLVGDLAGQLEVELQNVDSTWATAATMVSTDKCDFSAAATYTNVSRSVIALFSDTVIYDSRTAFTKSDASYQSLQDLDVAGATIVVDAGSADEKVAREFFQNAEIKTIVADKQTSRLIEVATGRADAAFGSTNGYSALIAQNDQFDLRVVDKTGIKRAPVAFLIPLGEYHFQQIVNTWLAGIEASGKKNEVIARYAPDLAE